jgi:ATP-dependent helicase/nuclease subunit A
MKAARSEMCPHLVISASAGSGKTFRLAHRYIRLLASGVAPDRICALTFSRKAAGEIFESIVDRLCRSALDERELALTREASGVPELTRPGCVLLLRALTASLHRLHIGTLDSFMVSVVRAFPLELGVPPEFSLMDSEGVDAAEVRRGVLEQVFDPWQSQPDSQRELLEAFKQATFGREEKGLGERLDRYVEGLRELYRVLPDRAAWGDVGRIWGAGASGEPAWMEAVGDPEAASLSVREAATRQAWPAKTASRWGDFADAAAGYRAGREWSGALEYMVAKLAGVVDMAASGGFEVKLDRTVCAVPADMAGAVRRLVRHVVQCELLAAIESTRGIHRILALYEQLYEERAIRQGRFSFSDAQHLLTRGNTFSGGRTMSRDDSGGEGRLYIDYRLDCQLDHWLLDEFQDTSDLQWAALGGLVDELLQDAQGRRSFFYVGDVKQAIYSWRGGNPRLFGAIRERYRQVLREERLDISQRSCPVVLEMVNGVFGRLDDGDLPAGTCERWARIWGAHESSERLKDVPGYACIVEPAAGPDGAKPGEEDRHRLAAALIREIDPVARGLSAAVLVRSNDGGKAMVDCLRRECPGMPVVHEGSASICDAPAVTLLLSLLTAAAHPGHTLARGHVRMSPLREGVDADRGWPVTLLREVEESGFRETLARWGRRLEAAGAMDGFGRLRMDDLLTAAGEFDSRGTRDIGAFVRFAEGYQVRQAASGGAVRVMTVHQAKGLGFDMVILPDLMGRAINKARAPEFLTARDRQTGEPQWTLIAPGREVAAYDPVLDGQYALSDEDAAFDALCVLYVAMTRPRQALYAVTSFPGASSASLTEAAFIKRQLAGDTEATTGGRMTVAGVDAVNVWARGDAGWFRGITRAAEALPPVEAPPAAGPARPSRPALTRIEPSRQEEVTVSAARLFAGESRDIVAFGSAIHRLFEQVEWLEESDVEAILAAWRPAAGVVGAVARDVEVQFRRVLTVPSVRAALARPADGNGVLELWRERSFEIVLEGYRWVSGAFDRVVIRRDASGRAVGAELLDYKSSLADDERSMERKLAEYRPQLELYAEVLSRLLVLPADRITRRILFTRTGAVRDV